MAAGQARGADQGRVRPTAFTVVATRRALTRALGGRGRPARACLETTRSSGFETLADARSSTTHNCSDRSLVDLGGRGRPARACLETTRSSGFETLADARSSTTDTWSGRSL